MAEPKKETVRIALPPRPEQTSAAPNVEKRETARIVLPTRTPPVTPIRRPPKITPLPSPDATTEAPTILPRRPPVSPPGSSPLLQPLPKPPATQQEGERESSGIRPLPPIREENGAASSVNRGPKNETARINILPRPTPTAAPAVNMTKTQPLLIHPTGTTPVAPVVITSKPIVRPDAIPRSLAWGLLAVSAVIFLIQIWNYVVS